MNFKNMKEDNDVLTYEAFVQLNDKVRDCIRGYCGAKMKKARILSVGKLGLFYYGGLPTYVSVLTVDMGEGRDGSSVVEETLISALVQGMYRCKFYISNPSMLRDWAGWKYLMPNGIPRSLTPKKTVCSMPLTYENFAAWNAKMEKRSKEKCIMCRAVKIESFENKWDYNSAEAFSSYINASVGIEKDNVVRRWEEKCFPFFKLLQYLGEGYYIVNPSAIRNWHGWECLKDASYDFYYLDNRLH